MQIYNIFFNHPFLFMFFLILVLRAALQVRKPPVTS